MLKLSKIFEGLEASLLNIVSGVETVLQTFSAKIKRDLIILVIQSIIFMTSIAFLTIGAVLFFSRFFSLDLVLLAGGAILLYVSLVFGLLKR